MWGANEIVMSRMTQRLLTWGEKGTGNPLMMMAGAGVCCGFGADEEDLCVNAVKLQEVPAQPARLVFP